MIYFQLMFIQTNALRLSQTNFSAYDKQTIDTDSWFYTRQTRLTLIDVPVSCIK